MLGKQFNGVPVAHGIHLRQIAHGFHQNALTIYVTWIRSPLAGFFPGNVGWNWDSKNFGHVAPLSVEYIYNRLDGAFEYNAA